MSTSKQKIPTTLANFVSGWCFYYSLQTELWDEPEFVVSFRDKYRSADGQMSRKQVRFFSIEDVFDAFGIDADAYDAVNACYANKLLDVHHFFKVSDALSFGYLKASGVTIILNHFREETTRMYRKLPELRQFTNNLGKVNPPAYLGWWEDQFYDENCEDIYIPLGDRAFLDYATEKIPF